MYHQRKIALCLVAALAFPSLHAAEPVRPSTAGADENPSGFEMALDALIARPLMLGVTAIGSVVFVLSLPFSAAAGDVAAARRKMIVEPARCTFNRPLGYTDWDCCTKCQ